MITMVIAMHAGEYSSSLSPVYDRAVRHGGDTLAETKYSQQCQLVIIFLFRTSMIHIMMIYKIQSYSSSDST
jgi:hypothetical protein